MHQIQHLKKTGHSWYSNNNNCGSLGDIQQSNSEGSLLILCFMSLYVLGNDIFCNISNEEQEAFPVYCEADMTHFVLMNIIMACEPLYSHIYCV